MADRNVFKNLSAESVTMIGLFLVTTLVAGGATFAVQQQRVATVTTPTPPQKMTVSATQILGQCRRFRTNAERDYTLIAFTDYECPACRQVDNGVEQFVKRNESRLNYSVLNYPLPQHKQAKGWAIYAAAKGIEGDFWNAHTALMQGGGVDDFTLWNRQNPPGSPRHNAAKRAVAGDFALAKSLEVTSTPTYFLCRKNGDVYKIASPTQIDAVIGKRL